MKPTIEYRAPKSGGALGRRAKASSPIPEKTADEAVPPSIVLAQSAEPSQITVPEMLGKLTAKLPKGEADKLKAFILRLERERISNRERQKAFRDRKRAKA